MSSLAVVLWVWCVGARVPKPGDLIGVHLLSALLLAMVCPAAGRAGGGWRLTVLQAWAYLGAVSTARQPSHC